MRYTSKLLPRLLAALLGFISLAAIAAAQDARILKKVGAGHATVIYPDGRSAEVTEGMSIPVAAQINTDSAVEIYLEVTPGAIATIKNNSHVVALTLAGNEPTL